MKKIGTWLAMINGEIVFLFFVLLAFFFFFFSKQQNKALFMSKQDLRNEKKLKKTLFYSLLNVLLIFEIKYALFLATWIERRMDEQLIPFV